MSAFYQKMQGTASRLLKKFQQGSINYIITGPATGPDYNPTPGAPISYPLDATASGVEQKYIKEGYIAASDIQVTTAVFDVEPTNEGVIEIDGQEKQIISVKKLPAAGIVVSWVIFVKS